MRAVIFGTGKLFEKNKDKLRKDVEIIAFLDNEPNKQGLSLNGIPVYSPEEIRNLEFDYVFLLSGFYVEMREQLHALGIPVSKIYDINQMEKLCKVEEAQLYGKLPQNSNSENILVFSHALTSTGAQNVLFTAVMSLNRNGYNVVVVSKEDGVLRSKYLKEKIPVAIIPNLSMEDNVFGNLVDWADYIWVNTAWLYYLISELNCVCKEIIWWIHESSTLKYIGEYMLHYICNQSNVHTYVVSEVVKRVFEEVYGGKSHVKLLMYGLPEYTETVCINESQEKRIFALIAAMGFIKGQDLFIQAVNSLPTQYKEKAEFWIVGRGKLDEESLRIAENNSCIKILGEIDNSQMPELYQQIDVVVSSSREDALPVVVTEGFMNYKLVILSDATGTAKYVTHGKNGLIMRTQDVEHLTELIKWSIDHEEESINIGRASREIYDKCFSMEVFERNLLEVLGERSND